MKCLSCATHADGFAVIPGVGEAGEIRFYCAACGGRERLKLRYWDARDLGRPPAADAAQLRTSIPPMVFSFDDALRMRAADLAGVLEWLEDAEVAASLRGARPALRAKLLGAAGSGRAERIRRSIDSPENRLETEAVQAKIVDLIFRL